MTAQMIVSLVLEVLNRNLCISLALDVLMLLCAILSRKAGKVSVIREWVVLILALALLPLVWLIELTILWILSLDVDVGVLNRNLCISLALDLLILLCAILSRKAGLVSVIREWVVLILALALLPLVWLIGLAICVGKTRRILPVVH
jgi:hypothetical protein